MQHGELVEPGDDRSHREYTQTIGRLTSVVRIGCLGVEGAIGHVACDTLVFPLLDDNVNTDNRLFKSFYASRQELFDLSVS